MVSIWFFNSPPQYCLLSRWFFPDPKTVLWVSNNPSDSLLCSQWKLPSYQRSRLRASLPPLLAAFHDVDCSSTATKESFFWAPNHVSLSSTWSAWFRWSCCPSSQWQIQPRHWGQTSHAWILVQYSTLLNKLGFSWKSTFVFILFKGCVRPEVPISAIISPRPASSTSSGSPSKVCYCVERGTEK